MTKKYPEAQSLKSQVAQNSNQRILIVLTNHDRLGNTGRKTGFYLDEAAHPHAVFTQAGFEVDFVSPTGEEAPIDPKSYNLDDPLNRQFVENERRIKKFEKQPSFVGSSLSALMKAGVKTGHTLVHCSCSQPVAVFMQLDKGAIDDGIDARECFRRRKRSRRWRLDMQAQWDAAQYHNWRAV